MKKGAVGLILILCFSLFVIFSVNFAAAILMSNHHCDSLPGSTIGVFGITGYPSSDCNNHIGGDGCYQGWVVTSCGYGCNGNNCHGQQTGSPTGWWVEPCSYWATCTDVVPCTKKTWYYDPDRDGYASAAYPTTYFRCNSPGTGWRSKEYIGPGDCDDTNPAVNPGATEICDNIDNDCDGINNEGLVCMSINKPYWSNMQILSSISQAHLGDTVLMFVPGTAFESKTINYNIMRDIPWWFDSKIAQSSTMGYGTWQAGKKSDGTSNNGNFYFIATIDTVQNTSEVLTVSSAINDAMPNAVITAPSNYYATSINIPIMFTQLSTDEDDFLRITWDFADGSSNSVTQNYSSLLNPAAADTTHSYSTGGVYYPLLTASEMTRSQSDTDFRVVYIYQPGINVMPVISEPGRGTGHGNIVNFDASLSHVANCSTSCPSGKTCFTAGELYCYYLHSPDTLSSTNINALGYELLYNWTFVTPNMPTDSVYGTWTANYSDVVEFTHFFPTAGNHEARLGLTYRTL